MSWVSIKLLGMSQFIDISFQRPFDVMANVVGTVVVFPYLVAS